MERDVMTLVIPSRRSLAVVGTLLLGFAALLLVERARSRSVADAPTGAAMSGPGETLSLIHI